MAEQETTRYWFLAYEERIKTPNWAGKVPEPCIANTVLAGIHPLVWLSNPSPEARKHLILHALWYTEIEKNTFDAVVSANYITVSVYPPACRA